MANDGEWLSEPANDQGETHSTTANSGWASPRSALLILAVLIVGIVIGRNLPGISPAIAADPVADATATREAEFAELNDLRTKVAAPAVCTPAPTSTPEPTATTVPAQAAGAEVTDANGWGITILSIQPVQTPDRVEANGQLMRVNLQLSNSSNSPMLPPFVDWRLVDAAGNRYSVSSTATNAIAGAAWGAPVDAHDSEERTVVFDVIPDAGSTFVLENDKDPSFRIAVTVESRA